MALNSQYSTVSPRPVRRLSVSEAELPPVTLVIAAHNESRVIEGKIVNCLQLDYPRDRLDIQVLDHLIVAGDGYVSLRDRGVVFDRRS